MGQDRDDLLISIRSTFLKEKNKRKFSLFILTVVSIILLILGNFNFKIINHTSSIINEIIYRLSKVASSPEKNLKKLINLVDHHLIIYSKNSELQNELENYKSKNTSLEILNYENKKLKEQLDDYLVSDKLIYSKIIIDKNSPYLKSFIVNKGSKDGINIGMTVFDQAYLVGKVIEVNYATSRVLLLSDINSNLPVTITPEYIQAIMTGDGVNRGKINFLTKNLYNKIKSGSIVYTSGTAGLIKSGIPVGRISYIDQNSPEKIKIDFYSDFTQLQYVSIASFRNSKIKNNSIEDNLSVDETNKKNIPIIDKDAISQLNKKIKIIMDKNKIGEEVRLQIELKNQKLEENVIELNKKNNESKKIIISQNKKIEEQKKIISKSQINSEKLEFLELNLLYGSKCSKFNIKNIFKKNYEIGSDEYKKCVLNKGKFR